MTEQLDLLSGAYLRDQGAEQVRSHNEEWAERADIAVGRLAFETILGIRDRFSAEDVRQVVGDPPHFNCMGAVFLRARKRGLIQPCGEGKASRAVGHATRLRYYRGVG